MENIRTKIVNLAMGFRDMSANVIN